MGNETNPIGGNFEITRRNFLEDTRRLADSSSTVGENVFADSRRNQFLGSDLLRFRLTRDFAPTRSPAVPAAPDPEKVADAVSAIKDSLDEGFTDWDVTHGDLENIQNAFRNLTAAEANEVFRQLSGADLQKWADELSGINGGYDESEKRTLFGELARKLDGANLARLGNALFEREKGKAVDASDVKLLSEAIAANAPEATKNQFLRAIAGRIETDEKFALGAAHVLASLQSNPQALAGALGALSDSQLRAVVKAASQETLSANPYSGTPQVNYDTKPLVDLLGAVSSVSNPSVKARVFEAAALQMKEIGEAGSVLPTVIALNKDEQAAQIRDALTGLINSDTTGIVRALEENENSFSGRGVTAYVKSMIEAGDKDKLALFINRLMTGNDLRGNAYARFGERAAGDNNEQYYRNAQVLGYFAGAIAAAAKQITSDRSKQADIVKNLFGTVLGATGAVNPASGIASSIANGLSQKIINDVVDGLNSGTLQIGDALTRLTIPHNPQTGRPYNGEAEESYKTNFSWVFNNN